MLMMMMLLMMMMMMMTTTARMMKTAIRTIMINIAVPVLMAFTTITVLLIIVVVCMLYQSSHIIIIYLHKPCHHTRFLSYSSRSPQDNSSASIVRAATNEGNMKKLHIYIYRDIYKIYIYFFLTNWLTLIDLSTLNLWAWSALWPSQRVAASPQVTARPVRCRGICWWNTRNLKMTVSETNLIFQKFIFSFRLVTKQGRKQNLDHLWLPLQNPSSKPCLEKRSI